MTQLKVRVIRLPEYEMLLAIVREAEQMLREDKRWPSIRRKHMKLAIELAHYREYMAEMTKVES